MLKNRVFIFLIAILIAITMIVTAAFILYNFLDNSQDPNRAQDPAAAAKPKPLSAAEVKDNTVSMENIMTNLAGDEKYIKVSLAFELENKKTKDEFQKLDFKVKDLIIRTLADLKPEQVQGSKGQDNLTSVLINKINSTILTQGKLKQIYITDMVLQ